MKILFFGMSGMLSRVPLNQLLQAGLDVQALLLPAAILPPYLQAQAADKPYFVTHPAAANTIQLYPNPGVLELAAAYHLPVYAVRRLNHEQTLAAIAAEQPDLICVSCFDQIFPLELLQLPASGCLNLHPSLLPRFRGPSPLFWMFREGVQETGVTVHFMDEGIDTGPIALQTHLNFADGLTANEAEMRCAEAGGRLLLEAVDRLRAGTLPRRPQPEPATYFSAPKPEDFSLDTNWPAQRAFNFMRGTEAYGRPYRLSLPSGDIALHKAVAIAPDGRQAASIVPIQDNIRIQFNPGILTAKFWIGG